MRSHSTPTHSRSHRRHSRRSPSLPPPARRPAVPPLRRPPHPPAPGVGSCRLVRTRGRHPGRHAQHRLRDLQPAQPGHQGPGLARDGAGRPERDGQLGQVGRLEQGQRGAPRRRHRRRLDGRARRRSWRARTARPSRSSTSTRSPSGPPSSSRRARRSLGRRPQGQEDRGDQGHRPVLLPAPVAGAGRAQARTT